MEMYLGGGRSPRIDVIWISLALTLGLIEPQARASGHPTNNTIRLPALPPLDGFSLTNLFPGLTFDHPVAITSPPGETNRLFIVERPGRIIAITNLAAPTKTVFLDVSATTYSSYEEAGLLGLAFHPGYLTNGYFYVFRTLVTSSEAGHNALHDQLSRFQTS